MEKIILDIDFDFFTKPIYYGSNQKLKELEKLKEHQKNSEIWFTEFDDFLSKFKFSIETKSQVSLDHRDFLKLVSNNINKKYTIIHFDAHHDIYMEENSSNIIYDNDSSYLLYLIKNELVSRIIWVYPPFCNIMVKNSAIQEDTLKKFFNIMKINHNHYILNDIEFLSVDYKDFKILDYFDENDYVIESIFLCYSPLFSKNDTIIFKKLTKLIKEKSKYFEIL